MSNAIKNEILTVDNHPIQIHEVVHLFPKMSDAEYSELKADIAKNGLKVPILKFGDVVVDGWHRLCVCKELGITPQFVQLQAANDAEMRSAVYSINAVRRNLDTHQRALIAARLCNTQIGVNQHTAGAVSQAKLAQDLGISTDSIARGKTVINKGSPELIAAVEAGKLDLSNAARLASLSKQEQSSIDFDDIKAIQQMSKEINKAKFAARREERLKAINAKRENNKPLDSSLGGPVRISVCEAH